LLSFCFFGTENMFARSVYITARKQFQYTRRISMVATSYNTQIKLHWLSEWVSVSEGIAGRTYQCCHTARPNDARFSTYLLHVQHYTIHKIRYKICRNKMLMCSCGVPPKSCSRVTRWHACHSFAIPGLGGKRRNFVRSAIGNRWNKAVHVYITNSYYCSISVHCWKRNSHTCSYFFLLRWVSSRRRQYLDYIASNDTITDE
jgi:hypothetical protein